MVPEDVRSVAQMRLPEASVLMVLAVLQPGNVPTCSPPVCTTSPVKVDVALVKSLVALTPPKVDVAVEEVALKYGASMPCVAESPPVKRRPPPRVDVPVLVPMMVPRVRKFPMTVKSLLTDDEAMETKPPRSVERPRTSKVDDALTDPETPKFPVTDEDASALKPPMRFEVPVTARVDEADTAPETWKLERTVEEAFATNPPASVESPEAAKVDEAVRAPVTFNELLTDEEARETKPP